MGHRGVEHMGNGVQGYGVMGNGPHGAIVYMGYGVQGV